MLKIPFLHKNLVKNFLFFMAVFSKNLSFPVIYTGYTYTLVMPNYLRYRIPGDCYFFTVNLLERNNTLLVNHIDLLRESVLGM